MLYKVDRSLFPPEMHHYFDLKWPKNLWELGEEIVQAPLSQFIWHLDYPFWKTKKGCAFNLKPKEVLANPQQYGDHYNRIISAETRYPLSVSLFGDLPVILDGIHRLAKLYLENSNDIHYEVVPYDRLLLINDGT